MSRILELLSHVSQQFSTIFRREEHTVSQEGMFEQDQHFESRIECGICLQPRLQMVTGKCQHRFCIECMYDSKESRREGMEKCPSCQQDSAFPASRPVIPEDSIEIQRALGVRKCKRCGDEMWMRDLEDHQRTCMESPLCAIDKSSRRCKKTPSSSKCDGRVKKRPQPSKRGYEVKSLLNDLGTGVTTRSSRSPRLLEVTRGRPARHSSRRAKQKS